MKNFGYTYLDLSAQLRRSQGATPPQGILQNIGTFGTYLVWLFNSVS